MTAAPYRGVPDWTQGTATIQNGQRAVTLTNSGIITTDAASGLDSSSVRSGDVFVVDGVGFGIITAVSGVSGASTATLTLATNWTAATQTNVAYVVIRMSMPSTGEVRALMQQLLARGAAGSPFTKIYADDSTARIVVDPHSGAPGLYVGPAGVSDAALLAALVADPATGAASFPNGVKSWALGGTRNRLRNPTFTLNRRNIPAAVALAAGDYGHDGVRAGAGGCTYSIATSGLDATITVVAGTLIMPIAGASIEGGSYVLAHDGTAQARVWQGSGAGSGSYATCTRASPLVVTGLSAATRTNVEFGTGTILRPQLEPGPYASAFERRPPKVELLLNNLPNKAQYVTPDIVERNWVTSNAWLSSSTPADNSWRAVCWSPGLGLFVAVAATGTGNRVMTSPDGVNWTARTSAVDNNWLAACWSAELGLFVAVATTGTGNRVMTSPDGVNWTARTSAADNNWLAVCWSPELGLFCAVANSGTGNRVMTSPDGVNWTARTSAADNSWASVCWSPELGLFVAVATTSSRVMTSPDGISWTVGTSAADNSWSSVCWSPELGLFVAVATTGTGNRVMTSPDGVNWTARTSAADNGWAFVCWSPELGLFCAVANTGAGNRVMTSPDGINWTARSSASDNSWASVCWSPELGLFCAASNTGAGNRVMTSKSAHSYSYR